MSDSLKVQPHHLERGAYLYVRQSSMRQVIENVESTKRQYALRGRERISCNQVIEIALRTVTRIRAIFRNERKAF